MRSILAPELVKQMANPQPIPVEHPVQDEEPDNGALLDWQNGDSTQSGHIALLGIRTIILCLVMSNGRVMTDGKSRTSPSQYQLRSQNNSSCSFVASPSKRTLSFRTTPALPPTPRPSPSKST
jgi:hypothetical protein